MPLPLYQAHDAPKSLPPEANTGLWYDKFCNQWVIENGDWRLDEAGKKGWLGTVTHSVGKEDLLNKAQERIKHLVETMGGQLRFFQTVERFVTGLGLEHPIENGFKWHHLLGVPYIPASSIKGLTRSWARAWQAVNSDIENRVFGIHSKEGSIAFLDALPLKPVELEEDIITPHYSPYYRDGQLPGDWYNPIPIPFLTVSPGTTFIFGILPCHPEAGNDVKNAMKWLEQALTVLGAGAKTGTGYGLFAADEKSKTAYERQRAAARKQELLQQMDPIEREMHEDGFKDDPDRFMEQLTIKWLDRLETAQTPAEQKRIAELLAQWYKSNKPRQWRKPNKKNEVKINLIRKYLD